MIVQPVVKRIALLFGIALLAVVAIVVIRGWRVSSRQVEVDPAPALSIDADRAAATLSEAVRFKTVSHQDPAEFDAGQFSGLQQLLTERFPLVHQQLVRESVNEH